MNSATAENEELIEVADEDLLAPSDKSKELVLSENPLLDDALVMRLTYDLATKMHKPDIIAQRYGLSGVEALKRYLRNHPKVVADARKLHAAWESGPGAEERIRMKFLQATEELIIPMAGIVADPRTPLQARIDGFKQIQRGAGLDGMTAAAKQAAANEQGKAFNLTINFAGGRDLRIEGAQVVESVPPATAALSSRLTNASEADAGDEDDEPDDIAEGEV